ncbi:MAG: 50S ribosomal protein L29 [Candidatus Aenigmatarchaeota archaeon]
MKLKDMRKLSADQLAAQLRDARLELAKERAASEIGTVKSSGRIRALRKTIARIHTLLRISQQPKPTESKKEV